MGGQTASGQEECQSPGGEKGGNATEQQPCMSCQNLHRVSRATMWKVWSSVECQSLTVVSASTGGGEAAEVVGDLLNTNRGGEIK